MKLNQKKEIVVQKSNERKLEINEGAKLARSVDALRETHSVEQQKLKKFRDDSLALLKIEISTFISERNELKTDVEFLGEQKRILLDIPLDSEWKKVEEKDRHLGNVEILLNDKKFELEAKEKELLKAQKKLKTETSKCEDMKVDSQKILDSALEKMNDADIMLSQADNKMKNADKYSEDKDKDILSRELSVNLRERNSSLKENSLNSRESQLNNREREIQDKYETLLRTIKRTNKN